MNRRIFSILLALLMPALFLAGCGAKEDSAEASGNITAAATTPNDTESSAEERALIAELSGSWEIMSAASPGGFPSVLHADSQGQLILEDVLFTYNGQQMFPEKIDGEWMLSDQKPAILVHPDSTSAVSLNIFVEAYSDHTMTLSDGNQNGTYARLPDPEKAVRSVSISDPQWNTVWETILNQLEGSWELINQDATGNYPAAMDIYNDGAPEINVLWQGSSYYCHWYVGNKCFCIDINDNFDQLMYHVELDENYLVMTRCIDENTTLMQRAYYYNTAVPTEG